ncbi:unnamed protein product [Discosporangium mesarthrocarpum]
MCVTRVVLLITSVGHLPLDGVCRTGGGGQRGLLCVFIVSSLVLLSKDEQTNSHPHERVGGMVWIAVVRATCSAVSSSRCRLFRLNQQNVHAVKRLVCWMGGGGDVRFPCSPSLPGLVGDLPLCKACLS